MPSEDWINNANVYKNTTHNRESLHDPYAVNIDRKEFTDGWFVKTDARFESEKSYFSSLFNSELTVVDRIWSIVRI